MRNSGRLRVRQLSKLDLVPSDELVAELMRREFMLVVAPVRRNGDDGHECIKYRHNESLCLPLVAMVCSVVASDLQTKAQRLQQREGGAGGQSEN